jgi:hypothetical protein
MEAIPLTGKQVLNVDKTETVARGRDVGIRSGARSAQRYLQKCLRSADDDRLRCHFAT